MPEISHLTRYSSEDTLFEERLSFRCLCFDDTVSFSLAKIVKFGTIKLVWSYIALQ